MMTLKRMSFVLAAAVIAVACGKKEAPAPGNAEAKGEANAPETAKPAAPADPAEAYKAVLEATARCPVGTDGIRAKDESACLKPLWDAVKEIDDPKVPDAEKSAKRKELQHKLAGILAAALKNPSKTVVFYALFQNQTRFEPTPELFKELEALMGNDDAGIAEWAAIARFWKRDANDTATLDLAKATFKAHKHERVRIAAAQYLGNTTFKGNKDVWKLLLAIAKETKEPHLVRSSAVTALGYLATDAEIKELTPFLPEKDLQYAAFYALKNGLATKASFGAVVDYVTANAKKPDKLFSDAMNIFLPFDSQLDKFPKAKAIKALSTILMEKRHHEWTRGYAARDLGKLKAKAELEKAKAAYAKDADPKAASVKTAIDEALAKAG
jgi:hypothetical protein